MQNSSRYNSNRGRTNNCFHNSRGNRNYHGNNRGAHSNSGFHKYNNQGFRSPSNFGVCNNCQIYGSSSHEAIDCYDRMNPDIFGKIPLTKLAALYTHYASKPSPSWILDFGATSHITHDISNISSPTPYIGKDKVYIGDVKGLSIHHIGSTLLNTAHASFKLNNVLHVLKMKHNLLSAYQFLKDNYCSLTLHSNGSAVKDRFTGNMLLQGPVKNGFYTFKGIPASFSPSCSSPHALVGTKAPVNIWHNRLGHPFSTIFRQVLSVNKLALQGKHSVDFFCSDCAIAKNHKLPFNQSSSVSTTSLSLLHCDVWGPALVVSAYGYQYYLLIVDDYSKYSGFFPLKAKSDVFSTFVVFKTYVENSISNKIQCLRSDSGGEFTSNKFKSFLQAHGISHQLSCPHTPEQNGCVERKHRHLVETARTLLVASKVPHVYWVESLSTTVYLINRLPISSLNNSAWEILFKSIPDYSKLKVFGCLCYPWLKPYILPKLEGKST
ncbi:hypothetical protein ACFX13_047228 [Malus domestica]